MESKWNARIADTRRRISIRICFTRIERSRFSIPWRWMIRAKNEYSVQTGAPHLAGRNIRNSNLGGIYRKPNRERKAFRTGAESRKTRELGTRPGRFPYGFVRAMQSKLWARTKRFIHLR